ncbi:MAG TPA: Clp protease N-terminal domain-containing protein [Hyphomicrobiaceae bacterium]|nr:Clp protease N-terminal domain-containing protein [Hyphomicrobiaceae bacterium]
MPQSMPGAQQRVEMSQHLSQSLQRASGYARQQMHRLITIEHVLLALNEDPDASIMLEACGIDQGQLHADVSGYLGHIEDRFGPDDAGEPVMDPEAARIINSAMAASQKSRRSAVNGAIVLAAIIGDGRSPAANMLRAQGVTFEAAIKALQQAANQPASPAPPQPVRPESEAQRPPRVERNYEPDDPGPKPDSGNRKDFERDAPRVPVGDAGRTADVNSRPRAGNEDLLADVRRRIDAVRQAQAGGRGKAGADQPQIVPAAGGGNQHREQSARQPAAETQSEPAPSLRDRLRSSGDVAAQARQEVDEAPVRQPPPLPNGRAEQKQPIPVPGSRAHRGSETPEPRRDRSAPVPEQSRSQMQPTRSSSDGRVSGQPRPDDSRHYQSPPPPPPPPPQRLRDARPNAELPPAGDEMSARRRQPMHPPAPPPSPPPAGVRDSRPQRERPLPHGDRYEGDEAPGSRSAPQDGASGTRRPPVESRQDYPAERRQQPRPDARRRETHHGVMAGQLLETIPRRMRVWIAVPVEVRVARADAENVHAGMQGGVPEQHAIAVTKAMSVRLRAPDGGFYIETASPETQWIENQLGVLSDDFASWRWRITPQRRGKGRLQLIVSARTVGSDGLVAETSLPDQVIDVHVSTNYIQLARTWGGWAAAAVVGGLFAKFGESILALGFGILG